MGQKPVKTIVFVLHGCPVGWLGAYGNEWAATPNLDQLAADSVVFDWHLSDYPNPAAARWALRTGRHQYQFLPSLKCAEQSQRGPDLLALLAGRGVHTALLRANRPTHDAPHEFYAGWDEVFEVRPNLAGDSRSEELIASLPYILDRLDGHTSWLLWIEIDRLLPPWEVPQDVFDVYLEELLDDQSSETCETVDEPETLHPWINPPIGKFDTKDTAAWEWLHRSFAAAVTTFDADIGRVFDLLRGRGLDRTSNWILTADYGFPLGEHGIVGLSRPFLHEETVHIPLVIYLPLAAKAGWRVAALTQPADLMPTILGLFGIAIPAGLDGHDLRSLWEGQVETVRTHAISGSEIGPAAEWAIRTSEWALLIPTRSDPEDELVRTTMLFEKPEDRWEVNDMRARKLELAEELEALLKKSIPCVKWNDHNEHSSSHTE
jgi:arylsulfatase A-like enzyme